MIPSAIQRIALGGTPLLGAITVLKDGSTGSELGKLDRQAAAYAGQGWAGVAVDQAFADLEDRVLDTYVSQVQTWLSKQ